MVRPHVRIGDHDVRVLRNGRETYPAMLEALGAARRLIRIEMYWWEPDSVGQRFREALVDAARRGVDVALSVDGFGSHALPSGYWKPFEQVGGRVAVFHPLLPSLSVKGMRSLLARNHRKVVVADERAFVGGLNFAKPWAPIGEGGQDWRDTALELRGSGTASHLTNLFEGTWSAVTGSGGAESPPAIRWSGASELAIVSNTPTERRGRRIRQVYLWALRQAKSTIDITCAYFAPRPLFVRALANAVRRGVRVRLLVPLRSDVEFARQASLPLLRLLSRRGVQVFGYGGAILHGKTAVVDGEWCTVGSHNLDGLSWAWNLECNVVVRHAGLAAQLTSLFEEDLCLSVRWPPRDNGILEWLFPDALRRWYANG